MTSGHRIGKGAHVGGSLGDVVGRDKVVTGAGGGPDVAAAVAELRALIDRLTREGAVGEDGSVRDPGAVVAAVREQPGRLGALAAAVAGGARDAVLAVVRGGLAELVIGLVGRT
ncbi:hypothetical protein SUDANB95_06728 [Actinosynnema sp. ALI-1.44]